MFATRDFTLAFALHIAVVASLMFANQWHTERVKFPERVMQVKMVSLDELKAMMAKPAAQPKPLPAKKEAVKPKPKKKPTPKPKPIKPKPVLNPVAPTKVKKKVVEEELDYDPFAPMESAPKTRVKKKVSSETALNEMLSKQITDVEMNHYIAGMQQAVEQQWKVPTEMLGALSNPLVELKLSPKGDVTGVRILESSGSKQLDATLLQAIYAAAPFDIPSQQYGLFKKNMIRFHPLK
ncbi:MAG TPA: TonB family protein [Mariprofundaceae bacterium]|nr:TonB family protein [Mariprofundaceae bacterium]